MSREAVWSRLVERYSVPWAEAGDEDAFGAAIADFLSAEIDRVAVIRQNLTVHRAMIFKILPRLPVDELLRLLPELVVFASWPSGYQGLSLDLIWALPRESVVARVETDASALLDGADEEQYFYMLRLYSSLDPALAKRLAAKAASSDDADVQFVGREFLEQVGRWGGSTSKKDE